MLQGANILKFFSQKDQRRWDIAAVKDFLPYFASYTIPCFAFAIETNEVEGDVYIHEANTDLEIDSLPVVIVADSTYKIVSNAQSENLEIVDGYYYLVVKLGATVTLYSDVFCLTEDTSQLLKIDVVSSDITLNESLTLPYSTFHLIFYLAYNAISISNETKEEGVEKSFGDIPIYSTVSIINKADINGTAQIFKMLSFLRAISVNGDVFINDVKVYGLLTEVKDEITEDDTMIITLTYREYNFISSKNAI